VSAYLAPSLVNLRAEINKVFAHRDKTSDGWIGDPAHAARISDHNPDPDSTPPDCVDAIDVDVDDGDPTKDLRVMLIRRAIAHPSTHYVISNGVIYSRERNFEPHAYNGTNGHYQHVHISILKTNAARNSTRPWGIQSRVPYPVLKYGSMGARVQAYTDALRKHGYRTSDTNRYQSPTVAATKKLQARLGRRQDGVAYYAEQHTMGLPTP
jgi:hypothetical protein